MCVCVCASAQFLPLLEHTSGGRPPASVPIDFVSVSLYSNFISVVSADGGGRRGASCVCVLVEVSDEPFCLP